MPTGYGLGPTLSFLKVSCHELLGRVLQVSLDNSFPIEQASFPSHLRCALGGADGYRVEDQMKEYERQVHGMHVEIDHMAGKYDSVEI